MCATARRGRKRGFAWCVERKGRGETERRKERGRERKRKSGREEKDKKTWEGTEGGGGGATSAPCHGRGGEREKRQRETCVPQTGTKRLEEKDVEEKKGGRKEEKGAEEKETNRREKAHRPTFKSK